MKYQKKEYFKYSKSYEDEKKSKQKALIQKLKNMKDIVEQLQNENQHPVQKNRLIWLDGIVNQSFYDSVKEFIDFPIDPECGCYSIIDFIGDLGKHKDVIRIINSNCGVYYMAPNGDDFLSYDYCDGNIYDEESWIKSGGTLKQTYIYAAFEERGLIDSNENSEAIKKYEKRVFGKLCFK